jgi:hypothetical protein
VFIYSVEGCGLALDTAISLGMTLIFFMATLVLPGSVILGGYLIAIARCRPF